MTTAMKNDVNAYEISDEKLEGVAGGNDDYTIVDAFVEWIRRGMPDG